MREKIVAKILGELEKGDCKRNHLVDICWDLEASEADVLTVMSELRQQNKISLNGFFDDWSLVKPVEPSMIQPVKQHFPSYDEVITQLQQRVDMLEQQVKDLTEKLK